MYLAAGPGDLNDDGAVDGAGVDPEGIQLLPVPDDGRRDGSRYIQW
jgi:hypothetical protein